MRSMGVGTRFWSCLRIPWRTNNGCIDFFLENYHESLQLFPVFFLIPYNHSPNFTLVEIDGFKMRGPVARLMAQAKSNQP